MSSEQKSNPEFANREISAEDNSARDLDWLAFQYSSGELSGADLDAFESLLATDERACAALARSVLLTQAVVQCEQDRPAVVPAAAAVRHGSRRDGVAVPPVRVAFGRPVIAAAMVACSVFLCVWVLQAPLSTAPGESAAAVAQLWIAGAEETGSDDTTLDAPLAAQEGADLADDEPIPGWMLAALSEQKSGEDEDILMND